MICQPDDGHRHHFDGTGRCVFCDEAAPAVCPPAPPCIPIGEWQLMVAGEAWHQFDGETWSHGPRP